MYLREQKAEDIYRKIYKETVKLFGHDKVTTTPELNRINKKFFGNKYLGTYSQDKLPVSIYEKNNSLYAIINVDTAGMQGSHWVAVAGLPNSTKVLVFDSFSRAAKTLLPLLRQRHVINTDLSDSEQKIIEESCGQYCTAWLLFVSRYGWENGKLI